MANGERYARCGPFDVTDASFLLPTRAAIGVLYAHGNGHGPESVTAMDRVKGWQYDSIKSMLACTFAVKGMGFGSYSGDAGAGQGGGCLPRLRRIE